MSLANPVLVLFGVGLPLLGFGIGVPVIYWYQPNVVFQYEYDGRTYENDWRAYRTPFTSGSRSHARGLVDRYPEGAAVTVYVDPQQPATGFLSTRSSRGAAGNAFFLVLGAMLLSAGVAGLGILGLFVL